MRFEIMQEVRQFEETLVTTLPVDTFSGTRAEAIEYARLIALDHALRIDVQMAGSDRGGYLTTNNGSFVNYYVIPERD